MSVSFLRHGAFFAPEDAASTVLNIIGVGATGSWIGLLAAKMGWQRFRVWDADVVASHNLPNQIYDTCQINKLKVEAFKEKLTDFNPLIEVETIPRFFTTEEDSDILEGVVVIAVDTLSARKDIYHSVKNNYLIYNVLETKMGFKHATITLLDPLDESSLDNWYGLLKDDSEVQEAACNERIITTLTNIVASTSVHYLCAITASSRTGQVIHSIPKTTIINFEDQLNVFNIST